MEGTPAPPAEPVKPAKKYLSVQEVEAQLLASQRPAQQAAAAQPQPQQHQIQPQLPPGPPAPEHVGQQQYIEEKTQFKRPQYQRASQVQQQQFPPQGQFPPPPVPTGPQRSPQRSPVRQTQRPPRPASIPTSNPPPSIQEIMAAENQRLIAEDAKRRKRNQKITEMVAYLTTLLTL